MKAELMNIKKVELDDSFRMVNPVSKKIATEYQSDEYERTSDVKMEQREKIVKFILENHDNNKNIRFFGFPGKFWITERMIERMDPNARFSGMEKNFNVFRQSIPWMPGKNINERRLILTSPSFKSYRFDTVTTKKAYHINGNYSHMTSDLSYTESEGRGPFSSSLIDNTCVWLDFTSGINVDVYTGIYNVHNLVNQEINCPICITLQYGRDQILAGKGHEGRIKVIEKALPNFKYHDSWVYNGYKNTQMINICGVLEHD